MGKVIIIEPNITKEENERNLERVKEVLESIAHGTVIITYNEKE